MSRAASPRLAGPSTLVGGALNTLHGGLVFGRRVRVIARHLAGIIPDGGRLLDIGCGDGSIASALMRLRPDLEARGVDVLVRAKTRIPVARFDGGDLPFADGSFSHVMLIDVLHHTDDPQAVLAEAARVASRSVVIKDHLLEGFAARPTLRFMDWVGNRGHGVRLPYTYLDAGRWEEVIAGAGLRVAERRDTLGLYPPPAGWLFDRRLHFIARLEPEAGGRNP